MNYPILLGIATPSVPTLINRSPLRLEALTAGLQKVSDQLELGKPALRTAENNQ